MHCLSICIFLVPRLLVCSFFLLLKQNTSIFGFKSDAKYIIFGACLINPTFFSLLQIEGNEKYIDSGPPFLILLHPALGPLWEVSRQKVNIQSCGLS